MGFIKEVKADTARNHATRAPEEGSGLVLYRFDVPSTSSGFSRPVSGAAEVIEAIEQTVGGSSTWPTTGTSRKMGQRCCCSGASSNRGALREDRGGMPRGPCRVSGSGKRDDRAGPGPR